MAKKQGTRTRKAARTPAVRSHVAASLLSVSPHTHTGKKLHSRHTSHGFLLLALLFTGILLFANLGTLKAFGLASSSDVHVSVNVMGTPPTAGAIITFPAPDQVSKIAELQVAGTCPDGNLVAIYNNGTFTGSTICTSSGDFTVTIQLLEGTNTLQAQNYDGVNQPGPTTPQVSITYTPDPVVTPDTTTPQVVTKPDQLTPAETKPAVPITVPQPSAQPCYQLPNNNLSISTKTPLISVNCIQRNLFVGDTLRLDVLIHGGIAPYALLTDWGDGRNDLTSIPDSSIHTLEHTFQTAGFHQLVLNTTDSKGEKSRIQTVVSVNGVPTTGGTTNPLTDIGKNIASIWIEAPVPLYVAAVTLVAGFWIGDIFQRIILNRHGLGSPRHKRS